MTIETKAKQYASFQKIIGVTFIHTISQSKSSLKKLCTRNADYSRNNNEKNEKPSFLKLIGVKFIQTISQSKSSSKSIHP
jgi:hypothetical protein